jgi:hypothetical protein
MGLLYANLLQNSAKTKFSKYSGVSGNQKWADPEPESIGTKSTQSKQLKLHF